MRTVKLGATLFLALAFFQPSSNLAIAGEEKFLAIQETKNTSETSKEIQLANFFNAEAAKEGSTLFKVMAPYKEKFSPKGKAELSNVNPSDFWILNTLKSGQDQIVDYILPIFANNSTNTFPVTYFLVSWNFSDLDGKENPIALIVHHELELSYQKKVK